jgi:hypothetical protein
MVENTIKDEPKIPNDTILWRRVHNTQIYPVEGFQNIGRVSTGAFKNSRVPRGAKSFSVIITIYTDHTAEDILKNRNQHSLISFSAGLARKLEQEIIYSPTPEEPGHGDVEGDKPKTAVRREFVRSYEWVIKPNIERFNDYLSGVEYAEIEDKDSNQ